MASSGYGNISVVRLAYKHQDSLCDACRASSGHVRPWLGNSLCPLTPSATRQCIEEMEKKRESGYGITYLLMGDGVCLGMGIINYIHPLHATANLGYWIRPEACGNGLAVNLCESLAKMAFSQINLHRLELFIEPGNKASMRVAEKLGADKEGLCRKRIFGRDAYLYALLAG
ncbi:GNAT family N-acetyltransferase [Salinimonas chungwhensis]|uniref:GNAT family N-acetyltransferase n=1 Tax=Salinimonas chungwhensis TaxID=265425 RepID=UPI001E4A2DD0|nr:GNAT family protein [Salinimonas chungwhensis]